MFLLGLVIMLFCFGFFMVYDGTGFIWGSLFNFIDWASFTIIVGALVAVLTATQSFKVFYAGIRAAILPKEEISEEMRGRAASLFRLLSKTAAMAAAIGMLICLLNILYMMNFSEVGMASILAQNIAVSTITPLYALLLIVSVFEPVVYILKKRHTGKR